MADEKRMPETLETIARKITALGKSMNERFVNMEQQFTNVDQQFAKIDQRSANVDQQFAKIDQRFTNIDQQFANVDQQFADAKAQLSMQIEALDDKVGLVYEAVIALQHNAAASAADHDRFTARLDNHEIRIIALERSKPNES